MNVFEQVARLAFLLAITLAAVGRIQAQSAKSLSEADLVKLSELQIDEKVIVSKLQKAGVNFSVDDGVVERLRKAGASDAVLAAVRKAGEGKKPGSASAAP